MAEEIICQPNNIMQCRLKLGKDQVFNSNIMSGPKNWARSEVLDVLHLGHIIYLPFMVLPCSRSNLSISFSIVSFIDINVVVGKFMPI